MLKAKTGRKFHFAKQNIAPVDSLALAENAWIREAEQELLYKYDALGRVISE
ncbi:hypothetical protein EV102420_36_00340 [Pseudescherichia vulneris NBRC 102420]|uniref:Rhs family protein n=1 Tax=Pseudescherichia vulneris NBRC 102420 TaxID=1115515 RepID=A0A090VAJ7_PSEVU|nr:hypothetical protein EV102420_36_00340 [Pseudescherichia vulneris NBRC 102420]